MSLKNEEIQLKRVTGILFPKEKNAHKHNQINQQQKIHPNNNSNLKQEITKLRRQVENILTIKNMNEVDLNQQSRYYLQKVKTLSLKMSNYPLQVLEASQTLISSIPIYSQTISLNNIYHLTALFKIIGNIISKKQRNTKMQVFNILNNNNCHEYQDKKPNKDNILEIQSFFNTWRYNSQQIQVLQQMNNQKQNINSSYLNNLIQYLAQDQQKLFSYLQNLQIKNNQHNFVNNLLDLHEQYDFHHHNYFLKFIEIVNQINVLSDHQTIYHVLEQSLNRIFNCQLNVYHNNGRKYEDDLVRIYGKNSNYSTTHLIPALNIIKQSTLKYINCNEKSIFMIDTIIYDLQNNNQSIVIPHQLLYALFLKIEEIKYAKKISKVLQTKKIQQQSQIMKIQQQQALQNLIDLKTQYLYSTSYQPKNIIKSITNFLKSIVPNSEITIKIVLKNRNQRNQVCIQFQSNQFVFSIKKDIIKDQILLYENEYFYFVVDYAIGNQSLLNDITIILNKYLDRVFYSLNLQNPINLSLVQYNFLAFTGYKNQTTLTQKFIKYLSTIYQCHCQILPNKYQQINLSFPKHQQKSLFEFLSIPLDKYTQFIKNQRRIKDKNELPYAIIKDIQNYQTYIKQFTCFTLNESHVVVMNKSIFINQHILRQLNIIFNLLKQKEQSKQIFQSELQLIQKTNRFNFKFEQIINKMLKYAFKKLISSHNLNKNCFNLCASMNKLYSKAINSSFFSILSSTRKNVYNYQNIKISSQKINKLIYDQSPIKLAFNKLKCSNNYIYQHITKIQLIINAKINKRLRQSFSSIIINKKQQKLLEIFYKLKIELKIQQYSFKQIHKHAKAKVIKSQQPQSLISSISKTKSIKDLFSLMYKVQYIVAIELNNQHYLLSNLQIVNQQKLFDKFIKEQYGVYEVYEKGIKLLWFYQKKIQLQVAHKNQLKIISKCMAERLKRYFFTIKPYAQFFQQMCHSKLQNIKSSYFTKWHQNSISMLKHQSYLYKQKIYHMNLQSQTIKQKIKIKHRENDDIFAQISKLQNKKQNVINRVDLLTKSIRDIEGSSQDLDHVYCLNQKIYNKGYKEQYFKIWRENAMKIQINKIKKQNMILLRKGIKKLQKLEYNLLNNQAKMFFKNIYQLFRGAILSKQKQNDDTHYISNNSLNDARLMTFQNNQLSYLGQSQMNFQQEDNYYLKKLDKKQPLQNETCRLTQEDISKANKGCYKLNTKTIKFLKRMGKLDHI